MALIIYEGGWGEASVDDLGKILQSVCDTFSEIDIAISPTISVRHSEIDGPMAIREKGPAGEHEVLLSSTDCYWSQHAYQFSHEYCHLFVGHQNSPYKHEYKWFEESLCELASIWCLRRMSEIWSDSPPYESWREYALSLKSYAEDRVGTVQKFASIENYRIWLDNNMCILQKNALMREMNLTVAAHLLELFEESPNMWKAAAEINVNLFNTGSFDEYLDGWKSSSEYPESVEIISNQMGYMIARSSA